MLKKISPYRQFQIIAFTAMAILFFIFYLKSEKTKRSLTENAHYTIATTNGTTKGFMNVLPFVDFIYYVNGTRYNSSCNMSPEDHDINTEGGRYLVMFSTKNRKNCMFLYDCPIPDSILTAPDEGWKAAPFNCDCVTDKLGRRYQ